MFSIGDDSIAGASFAPCAGTGIGPPMGRRSVGAKRRGPGTAQPRFRQGGESTRYESKPLRPRLGGGVDARATAPGRIDRVDCGLVGLDV